MEGVVESGSGRRLVHNWASKVPVYKEIITGYPYEVNESNCRKNWNNTKSK